MRRDKRNKLTMGKRAPKSCAFLESVGKGEFRRRSAPLERDKMDGGFNTVLRESTNRDERGGRQRSRTVTQRDAKVSKTRIGNAPIVTRRRDWQGRESRGLSEKTHRD